MYIQRNKSKNSKTGKVYTSVLLCSKYREGKKVKTRTVANLSHLSDQLVLSIENALRSEKETTVLLKDISIKNCIDYGYLLVVLHTMKQLRIDEILEKTLPASDAILVKAMLIGKLITCGSKLSIFNWLERESGICKLIGLDKLPRKVDPLYYALGQLWLHQTKIEKSGFAIIRKTNVASSCMILPALTSRGPKTNWQHTDTIVIKKKARCKCVLDC